MYLLWVHSWITARTWNLPPKSTRILQQVEAADLIGSAAGVVCTSSRGIDRRTLVGSESSALSDEPVDLTRYPYHGYRRRVFAAEHLVELLLDDAVHPY